MRTDFLELISRTISNMKNTRRMRLVIGFVTFMAHLVKDFLSNFNLI